MDDEAEYYSGHAFELSAIVALFSKAKVGDTITFSEISKEIGKEFDQNTYSAISRAKIILEESKMVFVNIRCVGYKRLNDAEIVREFQTDRRKLRKRALRAARRLTNVQDFESLTPENKLTHQAGLSILAAIGRVMSPMAIDTAREVARNNSGKAPIGEILRLMGGKGDDLT